LRSSSGAAPIHSWYATLEQSDDESSGPSCLFPFGDDVAEGVVDGIGGAEM
jgi:hypothetical protein